MAAPWSTDHLRLHQQLSREPQLLPAGAPLLLAVSGGQDSMAMTALLLDLQRLHHWSLQLWHGDHRWRPESSQQAQELAQWAQGQGLPLQIDSWAEPLPTEAAARQWRYSCLETRAQACGASHVVTAHTADDRSETLLLQLARGSHRRGLASLQALRPLTPGIALVRPLLGFSRADTSRICQQLALPIWLDPSNQDLRFSRNRIRAEVLPVLEALHPGASRRIAAMAERLAQEQRASDELADLALQALINSEAGADAATGARLQRRALLALQPANRGLLLVRWLALQGVGPLAAQQLEKLLQQLEPQRGPGRLVLGGQGQELHWDRHNIWLAPPAASPTVSLDLQSP
ncbi:MAG: tRNA lysidine(34) synthetase TilS [Synechococcus lacustris]